MTKPPAFTSTGHPELSTESKVAISDSIPPSIRRGRKASLVTTTASAKLSSFVRVQARALQGGVRLSGPTNRNTSDANVPVDNRATKETGTSHDASGKGRYSNARAISQTKLAVSVRQGDSRLLDIASLGAGRPSEKATASGTV
jgi:hypothetical protein